MREDEALVALFDALIVLALSDPSDLPELTDEEREALDSLGTSEEFVARLLEKAK